MTTLTTTRRSPWRRPRSDGIPCPRSTSVSCGWVPAGSRARAGPSIVGTSTVVPSAACGAETSIAVEQVVAVAHEARIVLDTDQHIEIAGRATALTGVAAAADADPLAVGDAGGDIDGDVLMLDAAPAAVADVARLLRRPCPRRRTGRRRWCSHLTERRPRDRAQLPAALAARAGLDRRARLGAVAVAVLARSRPRRT